MNKKLAELIEQYKKEFGTPIEHGVAVDKQLKLALNQLLETPTNSEEEKALIASIYDAFHTVKGDIINREGLYKKTKYFVYNEKKFEIFIKLENGKVSHGLEILDKIEQNKIINHII